MSFLVDTDICSAHLKERGAVSNRFIQYRGRLHVSVITVGELYTWALRARASPRRVQALQEMLRDVDVLDVSQEVGYEFGKLRAGPMDTGQSMAEMDLLIAATALLHGLTLVTHNVSDFVQLPGLNIVDWLAS